jgi:hypothetical protein
MLFAVKVSYQTVNVSSFLGGFDGICGRRSNLLSAFCKVLSYQASFLHDYLRNMSVIYHIWT